MEKVLVIDSNGVGHRAKHSMHGLSYDEMETGVIFGFFEELLRLAKRFNTNKFVFAWDSKSSLRKEVYPKYKYKRRTKEKTPEEKYLDRIAYEQFNILRREALVVFGFENIFISSGFEADDIIASIVLNRKNKFDFTIVSNDEDLFQLLNVANIYNLHKKELFTSHDFEKKFKITVDKWCDVKSIAGCGSDNVEGVPSVGEKTAIKYLNGDLKKGSKAYHNIKKYEKRIEKNKPLVILPYEDNCSFLETVYLNFKNEKFKLNDFHKLCDTYGFHSFKKNTNEWNKYFKMV